MKRKLGISLCLMAITALVSSCDQPRMSCTTGHGGFATKYTLKAGSKRGEGTCDTLKGEVIGLEKYNPSKPDDREAQDLTRARLAIRTTRLGELAAKAQEAGVVDEAHDLDSLGDFDSVDPDDNDVCTVPTFSTAEQDLKAFGTQPAVNMKYQWSNVRVYVTPAYPGTQIVADLEYSENGCTASYSVVGLWPAVGCGVPDMDGNPTDKVDPAQCNAEADPTAGRPTGSGINPDFASRVTCDAEVQYCVLTSLPDALSQ